MFFELIPTKDITAYELALILRLGGNKFIESPSESLTDKFRKEIKSANLERHFRETLEMEAT